ncbi:FemAB family PEP-CTERM system-associated protein [Catenovulum sp. 2E275]|uniref:FemAB family XrtA/PEP-CTERM system-associated protein n=1 Tax=Catenovulum sp. 2E275 TaxID=2980497 RepID=UPI0021CFB1FC|nr:FemAB family XrtA/PEP-CTERM system-associated protein [Catenovulum sp. 2E275]MCU4675559.1 FemAB family PEP-CTERM system-associated protein [Catenovulum sp. 2E275]
MISVEVVDELSSSEWDRYVTEHPFSSPYHLSGWRIAVEKAYQHKSIYLAAYDQQKIVGVLPLIWVKSIVSKGELCALPFCDVGGCLADDEQIKQALLNRAFELAKNKNIPFVTHRLSEICEVSEPSDEVKVRMLMPLPENSKMLWDGFKSKLRSQIRKAEKNGLTATIGRDKSHLDGFYQVFCRNMRDLGSPVHSLLWFQTLVEAYADSLIIANVYFESKVVGAGIVLLNGDKACIPWASTNSDYNRLAPNMLLYWKLLEYVCDAGVKEFDFGRSSYGEGTFKFKSQWGACPKTLVWEKYNANGTLLADQITNKSKFRDVVETTWQKMPLGICNLLGPKIRKYISL